MSLNETTGEINATSGMPLEFLPTEMCGDFADALDIFRGHQRSWEGILSLTPSNTDETLGRAEKRDCGRRDKSGTSTKRAFASQLPLLIYQTLVTEEDPPIDQITESLTNTITTDIYPNPNPEAISVAISWYLSNAVNELRVMAESAQKASTHVCSLLDENRGDSFGAWSNFFTEAEEAIANEDADIVPILSALAFSERLTAAKGEKSPLREMMADTIDNNLNSVYSNYLAESMGRPLVEFKGDEQELQKWLRVLCREIIQPEERAEIISKLFDSLDEQNIPDLLAYSKEAFRDGIMEFADARLRNIVEHKLVAGDIPNIPKEAPRAISPKPTAAETKKSRKKTSRGGGRVTPRTTEVLRETDRTYAHTINFDGHTIKLPDFKERSPNSPFVFKTGSDNEGEEALLTIVWGEDRLVGEIDTNNIFLKAIVVLAETIAALPLGTKALSNKSFHNGSRVRSFRPSRLPQFNDVMFGSGEIAPRVLYTLKDGAISVIGTYTNHDEYDTAIRRIRGAGRLH